MYNYVYPGKEAPTGYREYSPFATYKNIQSYIFWDLLNNDRMDRMIANEVQNGKKAYSATEMMDDLFNAIFADTMTGRCKSKRIWYHELKAHHASCTRLDHA